jgi:PAS domain S-box-containing protein
MARSDQPFGVRGLLRQSLACVWLAAVCVLCLATASQAKPPQHVLVLHAYHQGYQWTDNIQSGLAEALARLVPQAMVHVEYMDTKRQAPEKSFPPLAEFYAKKYAGFRPDVILASDDNALDFLLAHRDRLFPGSPVVFCGVNDYREGRLQGQRGYAGVSERADIRGTIEAALKLMPSMRRLVIITDATETGRYNRKNALEAVQPFLGRLEVQELAGLPFGEVAATLSTLSPDAAILHMGLFRDPDGASMDVPEFMAFTRKATPQPVFGVWDFLLGHHTVGGVMVSGAHQGQAMAELAARVLGGERVDDIPVVTKSPNAPMFDYRELTRQGFSLGNLPRGSIVLNRPDGLWQRYWVLFVLAGSVFVLMAAAIGLLWVNILRRRRAEAQRRISERRSRGFMEALSIGVVELDLSGRIVFANPGSYAISGAPQGSLPGKNVLELAGSSEARQTITAFLSAAADGPAPPGSAMLRLDRFDGGTADLKVDWLCMEDAEGRVTGFLAAATDLTELRRAEREREAQHRFSTALMDAIPTPLFAKDTKGRYVRVNRAFCEFLGRTEQQLLGQSVNDLGGPPEFMERIADLDRLLYAHQGQQVFEAQANDGQGRLRELLFVRSLFFDAAGQPEGIVGVMTDITARKQTEGDLRESREKYRIMFENLPLGLAVTDITGRYLEVNRAFEEIFGSPRERLLGVPPQEREFSVRHQDGTPFEPHELITLRATREQQLVQGDHLVIRPDGTSRYVSSMAAPLPLPGYGAMLAVMDINERKRLEQVIQSRLAAVTSPPGEDPDLSFTDLFSLEDIQAVQDAFARAVGVASIITTPAGLPLTRPSAPSEMGMHGQQPIDWETVCKAATLVSAGPEAAPGPDACPASGLFTGVALIRQGSRKGASEGNRDDDRVLAHWYICQVRPDNDGLDSEEHRQGMGPQPLMDRRRFEDVNTALNRMAEQYSELALKNMQQARHIIERSRAEEALNKAKEAAEAGSLAKSEFMANVSHEIRTPLHGVLGMLQLLQTTPVDNDQAEYLDKAVYSARSLLSVINDILDFSKIESGTLELSQEVFDPAQLVRASAAVFDDQARRKGLSLAVRVAQDLPKKLLGDPGKIRQILFNLLGNAVKFTDKGGVVIEVSGLTQDAGKSVLILTVTDTGVGIPEERQADVFDPFTQAEPALTKRFAGTGLGLAIVRKLTVLMDGAITLESTPQQGTSISLALRLDQAEPSGAPGRGRHKTLPRLGRLRLLLAEDNPVSLLAAKSFLQRAGHEVRTAGNGLEVLALLESETFDAVLMDIQMPEMDGVEATRRIRSHGGASYDPRIPIIALTAYAQLSEHKIFLDAGMDVAISKPLELADILEALGRVLGVPD